eukprot:TRINITY_DN4092_c0_g1_i2.p1 TRINITY_DN4092_c0_g1~~TRINITY_DN4092_c0_g1_i2.p1  ORF type:complete len:1133 (-),score=347.86 TRINITY_DN4092_c0_g1_i2:112-3510(-)
MAQFAQLLNPNAPIDVALLDQAVQTMYGGSPQQIGEAQRILTELQQLPGAWSQVDNILSTSDNQGTKFFALQILENTIKYQWNGLPAEQREGIKNFVVDIIIKMASDEATMRAQKLYLQKLNVILVQVLKQEWPHNWKSFIPDIVKSSNASLSLCENNLHILRLLSEEIFDFSRDQMTADKIKELKASLNAEFAEIHQLCSVILQECSQPSLVLSCLQATHRFLNWMPLGYIFETNLVMTLLRFFPDPKDPAAAAIGHTVFQNHALMCLTEIASISVDVPGKLDERFAKMCCVLMVQLNLYLPVETNIAQAWDTYDQEHQEFVQNLALLLSAVLKEDKTKHVLRTMEKGIAVQLPNGVELNSTAVLEQALKYMLRISQVDDDEIFKICLEFWNSLASDLYSTEMQFATSSFGGSAGFGSAMGSGLGDFSMGLGAAPGNSTAEKKSARLGFFAPVLSEVRTTLIFRMAKPEEVLIVEDENGDIVRETMPDTDSIQLYRSMKSTLVYLTHLDPQDTQEIMLSKLELQVNGTLWDRNILNKLCWAIGSISLTMKEDDEKKFLVSVIRDLLGLCEQKKGKDNKAVIASNIMYVVGQYPRFLKQHWKFLKTVVNKLFEFMHEMHPGVQDMACETFLKIAQKCRKKFVMAQPADAQPNQFRSMGGMPQAQPFINDILDNLQDTTKDLKIHQAHMFYEAVGCMLQAETDTKNQELLLERLMQLPNSTWQQTIQQAQQNVEFLKNPDVTKMIQNVLKTNVRVCTAMRAKFLPQLKGIYIASLSIYKAYSEMISAAVTAQGQQVSNTSNIKTMRGVRKEVLKLIQGFVEYSDDPRTVCDSFIPPLIEPILSDYQRSIPTCREAVVLSLMATVITKLKTAVRDRVPAILEAVFQCTLEMITQNFEDFPDHRKQFYTLLEAVNKHCFHVLFAIPAEVFKVFVDSIVWAFKHTDRDVMELGLNTMLDLLKNIASPECPGPTAGAFHQQFFISIMNDTFAVLTDTSHKPGFKQQCAILQSMFNLVETGMITAPLFDPSTQPAGTTNSQFLRQHLSTLLGTSFQNLSRQQVEMFVGKIFELHNNPAAFKELMRDFLVQLKIFTGDNSDLYSDERALEQQQQIAALPHALRPVDAAKEADLDAAMMD